jgi:hypothetical protein
METSVFWDVTRCSLLKVNQPFGGTCLLTACYLRHAGFLLGLFNPKREMTCSSRMVDFNKLHGAMSQKIEVFITTDARIADPI